MVLRKRVHQTMGTAMHTTKWNDNSFDNWIYEGCMYIDFANKVQNSGKIKMIEQQNLKAMPKGFTFYKGMKLKHKTFGNSIVKEVDEKIIKLFSADGETRDFSKEVILNDNTIVEQISIFGIVCDDITNLSCDAIVNATNKELIGGGGVDGAIHDAAGEELDKACEALNGCNVGEAKITGGFNLKAKYIIHTVGPHYKYDDQKEELLANCYLNSLNLAKERDIHTIAFPAISTGSYKYPIEEATKIAIENVISWVGKNMNYDIKIIFCCYSKDDFNIYVKIAKEYIARNS